MLNGSRPFEGRLPYLQNIYCNFDDYLADWQAKFITKLPITNNKIKITKWH
jgi:hypothetical protein